MTASSSDKITITAGKGKMEKYEAIVGQTVGEFLTNNRLNEGYEIRLNGQTVTPDTRLTHPTGSTLLLLRPIPGGLVDFVEDRTKSYGQTLLRLGVQR